MYFQYQMNRMRTLNCEFGIGDGDRGFYFKVNRVLYEKMLTGPLPVEVEELERGEVMHDFQHKDEKKSTFVIHTGAEKFTVSVVYITKV